MARDFESVADAKVDVGKHQGGTRRIERRDSGGSVMSENAIETCPLQNSSTGIRDFNFIIYNQNFIRHNHTNT